MSEIKTLTPQQEARLLIVREEWRQTGLSTDPCDPDRVIASVRNLYAVCNLKEPTVMLFSSPVLCLLARQVLCLMSSKLEDQLRDQLWNQLGGPFQPLWTIGNMDAYWLAFYKFGQETGVKYHNQAHLDAYVDYAENCGVMFAYEGFAFVSDRPRGIHFNQDCMLHNEYGMAVKFSDGWGVSAWNGVRVPDHWITQKDALDPNEVIRTENVEQRVAGCRILGWPKMAEKLDRKIIDGDPDSDIGALIELSLEGLPEPGRFLMARCPRNGTICEGVPHISDIDDLPIDTALAAQAWRIGDPQSEYIHPTTRS